MAQSKSTLNRQPGSPPLCRLILALSLTLAAQAALAECEMPALEMEMPDGKTASADEMTRAQAAVNTYVAAGEAYIACVEAEEGRNQAERLRNAMLDDMEKIAGAFNRQLRLYRKAQS